MKALGLRSPVLDLLLASLAIPFLGAASTAQHDTRGLFPLSDRPSHEILQAIKAFDESPEAAKEEKRAARAFLGSIYKVRVAAEMLFEEAGEARKKALSADTNNPLPRGAKYRILEFLKLEPKLKQPKLGSMDVRWLIETIRSGDYEARVLVSKEGTAEPKYRLYEVALKMLKDRALVTSIEEDTAFDAREYFTGKERERLLILLQGLDTLPPQQRQHKLGPRVDVRPLATAAHLDPEEMAPVDDAAPLGKPWRVSVLAWDSPDWQGVPERYMITVQRKGYEVQVLSCERDPTFKPQALKRHRVAEFVRKYFLGDESFRASVRAKDASTELPKKGKVSVSGSLDYSDVRASAADPTIWECRCRIKHDGGFGKGWHRNAKFECRAMENDEGQLRMIADKYAF